MEIDFTPFFKKYEELVATANQVFDQVKKEFPSCVKCKVGCSDCCHALFDLTLVEALYINHKFNEKFVDQPEEKSALIEKANSADRTVYRIKRAAYKDLENGKPEREILENLGKERVRCPLLNAQEQCDLYENRPITCRFYGIPTAIDGKGHTCGKSDFKPGEQYPTVNLDAIHSRLYQLSDEIVKAIGSRHSRMSDLLVPLSMALLTVYDEEYLGIPKNEADTEKPKGVSQDG